MLFFSLLSQTDVDVVLNEVYFTFFSMKLWEVKSAFLCPSSSRLVLMPTTGGNNHRWATRKGGPTEAKGATSKI